MEPVHDEFERLRKLLALKRHEKPPPGYFENFSDGVLARIKAEQEPRGSWWQSLLAALSARPMTVALSGAAAALLLFAGVNMTRQSQPTQPAGTSTSVAHSPTAVPVNDSNPVAPTGSVMVLSSTSAPPDFLVHPGTTSPVERTSYPKR